MRLPPERDSGRESAARLRRSKSPLGKVGQVGGQKHSFPTRRSRKWSGRGIAACEGPRHPVIGNQTLRDWRRRPHPELDSHPMRIARYGCCRRGECLLVYDALLWPCFSMLVADAKDLREQQGCPASPRRDWTLPSPPSRPRNFFPTNYCNAHGVLENRNDDTSGNHRCTCRELSFPVAEMVQPATRDKSRESCQALARPIINGSPPCTEL